MTARDVDAAVVDDGADGTTRNPSHDVYDGGMSTSRVRLAAAAAAVARHAPAGCMLNYSLVLVSCPLLVYFSAREHRKLPPSLTVLVDP